MALHRSVGVWAIGWALLGVGCFTEPVDSTPSTTANDMCALGALGCECNDDGTCDVGLACDPSALLCIPEGCAPGEFACTCAEADTCMGPLVCELGICMSPADEPIGSSTGGDAMSTSAVSGAATDAEPSASSTDTGTDDDASTDDATDTGEDTHGGDTGTVVDCDAQPCAECQDCADIEGDECEDVHAACEQTAGCMTVATCLQECGLYGFCFDPCCEGATAAAVTVATDLAICRSDGCASACSRYDLPTACNG